MKINTITCHDVYNYGASLQAYALQTYLSLLGNDVEIINYKPAYLCRKYNFWYIYTNNFFAKVCAKNVFMRLLYCLIYAPIRYKTWRRIIAFDSFTKEYLNLTKRYSSIGDLRADPPRADYYIAGSDQIWNTSLPNGKDDAFFLDFGDDKVRRISYAASFALTDIEDKQRIGNLLRKFKAVSVREVSGLNILKKLNVKGVQVLDPVYLLNVNEWNLLAKASKVNIFEPYILIYDIFCQDSRIKSYALEYSKANNLCIFAINDSKTVNYAKNIKCAGPVEFVSLISKAKFLISNSFHATSFALIYHVPFIVIYDKPNSCRMSDLLESVGLAACFNPKLEEMRNIKYDWKMVDNKLDLLLSFSKQFLTDNI